ERARVAPYDLIEAKRVVVEVLGLIDVFDVKVDVTDPRAGRHSGPSLSARRCHQTVYVKGVSRHRQLAILMSPSAARAIGVNLDPEPVRICEVKRFADEMVRHACICAEV